jgi:hypothetical protein
MGLNETQQNNAKLKIWQQNVNKSTTCQHDLISSGCLINEKIDIIALQELHINFLNKTIAAHDWIAIYPTIHGSNPECMRSTILICSHILTDSWMQINLPSGDITALQLKGDWGWISIFNIYNDCKHSKTVHMLTNFHRMHEELLIGSDEPPLHILWLGDFN